MTAPLLRSLARALRRLRGEESGLTVVEGVVAALLLVIGALGVLQVFDASSRTNFRAEQSQVVNNRIQAELEQIRQLPYAKIALAELPGSPDGENDPRSRVAGTTFAVDSSGADARELVVNAGSIPGRPGTVSGGVVDPGPEPFSAGDVSGTLYRFVTWTDDPSCPDCDEGYVKRIVVAAKVDDVAVSFDRPYQEVQTEVSDPSAAPDQNPAPPGDEQEGNVAELWLTDTTCNNSERQPITGDHATHNTRGRCANGLRTGSTRGAPDLLFTEAPEINASYPSDGQPLFNYSTDMDVGGDGKGLTMPSSTLDSCLLEPVLSLMDIRGLLEGALLPVVGSPGPLDGLLDLVGGEPNKHNRVHTWVSPPVGGNGGALVGEGNLDLWTRTVNGTSHPGEICVTLFIRQTIQVPVLPTQICLPLLGCHAINLGLVDLSRSPPRICLPLLGCHNLNLTYTSLEVDVPFVNVGLLTNQEGVTCHQGLNLTHFRCGMNQWPTEWSKVSIPLTFAGVNTAGQLIPAVLPPESRIGIKLMVRNAGTHPGQGLEFMYDHVDFNSRLQLKTESLLCLGNC